MKAMLALGATLLIGATAAQAAMVTKTVAYDVGGKQMQSVLVYDDASKSARPGLVMTPDWLGMNDNQVALAKQIAGKDYVILVADVYGADVRPKNADEAGAAAKNMYAHRADLRARIAAALDQLTAQKGAPLDGKHWGAFGFCFGGATTLDLARGGAAVQGVVSFHGNLAAGEGMPADNIKAKVLALNGGDDKFVSEESIVAFQKEMRDAGADWKFVSFGGAVHCFAIPSAQGEVPGCKYDERTSKRAFVMMHDFFNEAFAAAPMK